MRRWAKLEMELLGAIALLALLPATAAAAKTISVNDSATDAKLTTAGSIARECESEDGPGHCTLRAAVELANEEGEATINVPVGTYVNTDANGGTLEIKEHADVVIDGAGAGQTIIDGGGASTAHSVFTVEPKASLTVHGATIQDGLNDYGGGIYVNPYASITISQSTITDNTADFYGGGIYGDYGASITIEQSTITGNSAGYGGGGVYAESQENNVCEIATAAHAGPKPQVVAPTVIGGLTVKQSTIADNTAGEYYGGYGGGIYAVSQREYCPPVELAHSSTENANPATLLPDEGGLTVEKSTVADNTAGGEDYGYGGGIYEDVQTDDPIVNSTIADNVAGQSGGGIYAANLDVGVLISDTVFGNTTEEEEGNNLAGGFSGRISLRNTIVAEPTSSATENSNCEGNIGSLVPGAGYNLVYPAESGGSPNNCGLSPSDHDLLGVAPGFDPGLQSNGGLTQTVALLGTSPAVDYVPHADCLESEEDLLTVDQRGYQRPGIPGDTGCDIGAYEYQYVAPPATPKTEPKTEVLGVKITAPKKCTSKRDITIHIQNVKQLGVVSAVVSIDGKHRRTLTGKQLTTAINLIGLPKGTFTIEIVAHTRRGHTLHGERLYHTCHTKLPGHSYLPL